MWLSALLGLLSDQTGANSRRDQVRQMEGRLGLTPPAPVRGDLAGRMTYVFRKYRNNEDVLVDLLEFFDGLVFAGLMSHEDTRSPFPEGVFPPELSKALGNDFVNPGVYSPLGEVFEWVADQFATKHREMRKRQAAVDGESVLIAPYRHKWNPVSGWSAVEGWGTQWIRHDLSATGQEWAVWPWENFYGQFLEVLDWVRATHPDLRGIGFRTAFARTKAWHAALPMEITKGGASRGIVVASWPDGATIERLITAKNLQDEGKALGHCIANYDSYATSGDRLYFSYRDASGASIASIEMMPATPGEKKGWVVGMVRDGAIELVDAPPPEILQLRGMRNSKIQDKVAAARIASWFLRNEVDIDPNTGNYLPTMSFLAPPASPQVLPLRTVPNEVLVKMEVKEPGTGAGWQEKVRKDDEQWSKGQLELADKLVEASDEAEMHGSIYLEDKELAWLFYRDEEEAKRCEILRRSWEELEMDIPFLDGLKLDSRADMVEALARVKASIPDLNVKIEALTSHTHRSSAYDLCRMIDGQIEHLDLVQKLRERDWFEEEEDYATYDPEDQRERALSNTSEDASDCFRSAKNFVTAWNKSNLTDYAMSEQKDRHQEGVWFSEGGDSYEDGEALTQTWLSFGFGYSGDDDPSYQAGDLSEDRPFTGPDFTSPLGALWGAGRVVSKEKLQQLFDEAKDKREAFLESIDQDGMKRVLPRKAVFFDKPAVLVTAASQHGVIVPYAILRQFQR